MVVVSGTGSICYGIDAKGTIYRTGGWNHILSDEMCIRDRYPSGGDVFKVVETGERGDYHIYGQRKDAGLSASCYRGDFKESAGAGGFHLSDEGAGQ